MTILKPYDNLDPWTSPTETDPESPIWAWTGEQWVRASTLTGTSVFGEQNDIDVVQGTPSGVLSSRPWVRVKLDDDGLPDATATKQAWHRSYDRVWRYWITTPNEYLGALHGGGVKDFVAAACEGTLPNDWTEKAAEDGSGAPHTVCTFTMTMAQVRALGSEQRSLETLGSTPDDVHFFERVADMDGFTGIERVSRQPTEIASQLYAPTELYQTSHPDAADARGTTFTEADVLDTTGLTLV